LAVRRHGRSERARSSPKRSRDFVFLPLILARWSRPDFKPFFQARRDLGYVDGQTITIDYLSANGQGERFADLAAELICPDAS
jgi:hypothetical protein